MIRVFSANMKFKGFWSANVRGIWFHICLAEHMKRKNKFIFEIMFGRTYQEHTQSGFESLFYGI